jgi:hypothetical protein
MTYAELEQFFEGLIVRLRERGVTCAITSGMACVHYGVAQATKDCDLLCQPETAAEMLGVLAESWLGNAPPRYRRNLSPPLDPRWLRGGWTSHFVWETRDDEAYLDVFGVPPRGSGPWEPEIEGFYAGRHIVTEMKRTDRGKDWPFITALGAQMLERRDQRGWLHLYDAGVLLGAVAEKPIPEQLLRGRPVLALAVERDPRLEPALHAETQFWHQLDHVRIRVYERALRPYVAAVRKAHIPLDASLVQQHEIRVRCAEDHLLLRPLADYGLDRLIAEARARTSLFANPDYVRWLPDVREYFTSLVS